MKIKTWLIGLAVAAGVMLAVVSCHDRQEQKQSLRDFDTINTGTGPNTGTGMTLLQQAQLLNDIIIELNTLGIDDLTAQDVLNLRHLIDSLNIHVDVNDTTGMLTNYARFEEVRDIVADSLAARLAAAVEVVSLTTYEAGLGGNLLTELQATGATMLSVPIGASSLLTTYVNMTDGTAYWTMFYLPVGDTLTGVKWVQRVQGVYTADNYNGLALYSVSGTTYTKVASTADDGDCWKGTAYSLQTKAFSSTYIAAAGLYMVALVYNTSAQTTAPSIYNWNAISAVSQLVTGSHKLTGTVATQNTLPDTEVAGDITTSGEVYGVWLY